MSTTVRINESDKDLLRRLQADFERKFGRVPTHQELLGKLIEFGVARGNEFLETAAWRPLSPERIRAMRKKQGNYGNWSASEIDEVLYGGDRP